jgi:hypothetical protein
MRTPAASCTYGRLSAPSALMNCERVIGLRMLYDVIARKEYANIITAVAASPSRNVTILSIMFDRVMTVRMVRSDHASAYCDN